MARTCSQRERGKVPTQTIGDVPQLRLDGGPTARLKRIGVIDVGSNSVRLVVFDGMARSPAYFYNEKVLCGLGAGLGATGRLSPEGWVEGAGGAAPVRRRSPRGWSCRG